MPCFCHLYESGFCRETETIGYMQIYIRGELLLELAHTVTEAEKSLDLPIASWRIRTAEGYHSIQGRNPENWEAAAWELRALVSEGRERWMSQLRWENLPSLCPQWIGWCPPQLARVHIFTLSIKSNVNLLNQMLISSRNTLTDTPKINVLPAVWPSVSPVKLKHKINHHTTRECCL